MSSEATQTARQIAGLLAETVAQAGAPGRLRHQLGALAGRDVLGGGPVPQTLLDGQLVVEAEEIREVAHAAVTLARVVVNIDGHEYTTDVGKPLEIAYG